MKLLAHSSDRMEIDSMRFLLESRGIPIYIANENTGHYLHIVNPLRIFEIWVVLDQHYDDALALLQDENHEVSNPVNVAEFYRGLDESKQLSIARNYTLSMVLILALAIIAFLFTRS